jgi:hypothetical protein
MVSINGASSVVCSAFVTQELASLRWCCPTDRVCCAGNTAVNLVSSERPSCFLFMALWSVPVSLVSSVRWLGKVLCDWGIVVWILVLVTVFLLYELRWHPLGHTHPPCVWGTGALFLGLGLGVTYLHPVSRLWIAGGVSPPTLLYSFMFWRLWQHRN